jgi:dTDP-4-dehydrorhamnose 3,5-epimerase
MKELKVKKNVKIITKNTSGNPNGFLVPIINIHDEFVLDEQWPKQVYLTVAAPRDIKGPHLHYKRWGLFTCIKGNIKIVVKVDGQFQEYFSGENHDFQTIQVPAGIPAALVNIGDENAYILNMPAPAWQSGDRDEWDVSFDDYDFFSNK